MNIRQASLPSDLPVIVAGGRAFASAVPEHTRNILPDPESEDFIKTIRDMCYLPGATILIAFDDRSNKVHGGIGYLIGPYFWNRKRLAIEEMFWWVYPGASMLAAPRLFDRAMKHADACGCTIRSFGSLINSPPSVDRLYRKHGMKPAQTNYLGEC